MIAYFYAMMVYATTNLQQQDGAFSGDVLAIILVILLASVLVLAAWLVIVGTFTQDERFFFWKSAKRRVREMPTSLSSLRLSATGPAGAPEQASGGSESDGGAPVSVEAADLERRDVSQDEARV